MLQPWIDLVQFFHDHVSPVSETWKNYGKTSGWTLLFGHKDRTIFYLFPNHRFFTVLFVYGEKAVSAAKEADLPDETLQLILHAKPYAGRQVLSGRGERRKGIGSDKKTD